MLVYANHLPIEGAEAGQTVLKAIGGWLEQQLGFGLRPEQLTLDGEYSGHRGDTPSSLRIRSCYQGEPALCSWVLKHADHGVHGRQWIVEVGVKKATDILDVSCVVKTDEHSTLVSAPVNASQPRVVRYIVSNVLSARDATFKDAVPGETLRSVGENPDSYRSFLEEIERPARDCAIVLVSSTDDGHYIVDPPTLQTTLVGLAQVVQVLPDSDTYEMAEILGTSWSAWGGAVKVLSTPSPFGHVRSRYFLPDEIRSWQGEQQAISQILAWVTANTNVSRLRMHVRPHGVMLLSTRRRLEQVHAASAQMSATQLRQAVDDAAKQAANQETYLEEIVAENSSLEAEVSRYKDELGAVQDDLRTQKYLLSQREMSALNGGDDGSTFDPTELLTLAARKKEASPLECLAVIENVHSSRCTILETARSSAKRMTQFANGRELLGLLVRLVSDYRDALMNGGDTKARQVFTPNQFAATESGQLQQDEAMLRQRTFEYEGEQVPMLRHLKIGVADNAARTLRVHFHWDNTRKKIVIGYCGEHLAVPSHG